MPGVWQTVLVSPGTDTGKTSTEATSLSVDSSEAQHAGVMDARTALSQHDGPMRRQALLRSVSRSALDAAVRHGTIVRLRRGWYALGEHPAQPVLGTGCGLGCVSALRALGVWTLDNRLHVHIPETNAGRSLPRDSVRHWSSTPLTGWRPPIPVIVLQVARCQPLESAVATIDSALNRDLLTPAQWRRLCRQHPRTMESLRLLVDGRAESGLESLTRLRLAEYSPEPQVAVGPYRLDLLIGHVAVELDGFGHHAREAFDVDRRRDAYLAARGFTVLRFSYEQVMSRFGEIEDAVRHSVTGRRTQETEFGSAELRGRNAGVRPIP